MLVCIKEKLNIAAAGNKGADTPLDGAMLDLKELVEDCGRSLILIINDER